MNTELFQQIHEIISPRPDLLRMSTWEEGAGTCGTTRCIAGWAINLTTGEPIYSANGTGYHASFKELAQRLDQPYDVEMVASALLGLDDEEASVFYVSDEKGAEFVRLAAAGDDDAALAILED